MDLEGEDKINPQVKSWLAFAKQKCAELALLKQALEARQPDLLIQYSEPVKQRLVSDIVKRQQVREQVEALLPGADQRNEPFEERKAAQQPIPAERLWVNPDCGLKTRKWEETKLTLANMVNTTKSLREVLEKNTENA